jgi:hypothetical protein
MKIAKIKPMKRPKKRPFEEYRKGFTLSEQLVFIGVLLFLITLLCAVIGEP